MNNQTNLAALTTSQPNPNQLLLPKETAKELDIAEGTLAVWRCTGRYNLPFVKIGSKIRYRRSDIQAFIESRVQTQTI